MAPTTFQRREFVKGLTGTVVGGVVPSVFARNAVAVPRDSVTVAAVQFNPTLGRVRENLEKCRLLVRQAFEKGAKWVVLPEFFSSGLAMHERTFAAHRPLTGEPMRMLKDLAAEGNAHVGGSFLAQSGGDIFNTFVLACPDGSTFTHDKDFPSTIFESSVYAGGEDAAFVRFLADKGFCTKRDVIAPRQGNNVRGVFEVTGLRVGVAACWELVRYRTARRLAGQIDLLLGASGWWWSDPEHGWPDGRTKNEIHQNREAQMSLIREAPRRLARMLGVPVVHANFCGDNPGFLTSEFRKEVTGKYLGESQIVDSQGKTLNRMDDEEGIIVSTIVPGQAKPTEDIPDSREWIEEVEERAMQVWYESGAKGRDYYLEHVRPRLK